MLTPPTQSVPLASPVCLGLSASVSVCLSGCVWLSVCVICVFDMCVYLPACLPVCLFAFPVRLSGCLSAYLPACLSVYLDNNEI